MNDKDIKDLIDEKKINYYRVINENDKRLNFGDIWIDKSFEDIWPGVIRKFKLTSIVECYEKVEDDLDNSESR